MNIRPVAVHLTLWLVYLLLYATLWKLQHMTFGQSLLRELYLLPVKLILVYTCILYLVPRFLQNKKYITFILLTAALVVIGGILHNIYLHTVVPRDISAIPPAEKLFDWERISKRMTYLNSPMFFALTVLIVRNWYDQKEQNARIVQENITSKLQLLKNQLHPHFFFNTLNNLYSLTLQKSDQTPAMILKLADLMRYLTEQHDKQWVSLQDEIHFVQNYVALEEMRYQDKLSLRLKVAVHQPERILVPPLILSTLMENSFKHGVSEMIHSAFVNVDMTEDEQHVFFCIENSKLPFHKTASISESKGIGLNNLRSRLHIIYGNDFSLELQDGVTTFTARLKFPKLYEKT